MKRATIKDVAQLAAVSTTTVSHVVNRTRFVEEETRERVLQAIAALGYRPNVAARSLTTNRTNTIGVIVSDTSNHFFGELLRGIENIAVTAGYSLVVCNTDETLDREERYLNLLLSQQVDGIIAAATSQRWDALELADLKHMPIVFVDRTFHGMHDRPYIGVNNTRGAYLGSTHLIEHGYREIACLAGFQRLSSMRERLAGFEQALHEHGIPVHPDWVVTSTLSPEAGREATLQILCRPDRPKALFINNNFLTLGALQTLKYLDMHCPQDIALVGFDDHPWASVSDPPLTVVRQPTLEMGEQAATTLLSLLETEELTAPEVILECELIIRRSCGQHE
jgi:DNA-binding LacI/PurR family transcriptional regulator